MSVDLTVSRTLGGSDVAASLSGGDTGLDAGVCSATSSVTITMYLRHNGTNHVENLSYRIAQMSGTYGGDYSASADLTKILAHGDAGYGWGVEEDFDAGTLFSSPYRVKTNQADSYANRRTIQTASLLYNNATVETIPSAPVAGKLGASGNSTLGDVVKLRWRYTVPNSESLGGRRQWDWVFDYDRTT